MKKGKPSITAEFIAFFRALESSRRPRDQRLFEDPFASRFLRPFLRAIVGLSLIPGAGGPLTRFIDRTWAGVRAMAVARTRYIDDALSAALAGGLEQVVILGAGFDARACRIPALDRLRVFEVDHPDTQRVKKERLGKVLGTLPAHVTFVEADFTNHRLGEALAAAGFNPAARSFFILEGVVSYLPQEAIDALFRWASASAPAGCRLIFTYTDHDAPLSPREARGRKRQLALLNRIGEKHTAGLTRDRLPGFLRERGFELIEDAGAEEYCARYLGPVGLRVSRDSRIAITQVSGP